MINFILLTMDMNRTTLPPAEEVKALQLLALLELHKEVADFLLPVDYKALNIPDYPLIITHPMDISTVKQGIKASKYSLLADILTDIQLIWDNCKKFNDPSTVTNN